MCFLRILLIGLLMVSGGCSRRQTAAAELFNAEASLPADLGFHPLRWKVISATINAQDATMATLLGNDLAVNFARTHMERPYPAQSMLSLVTWQQENDPHWFGARIPGRVKSVELVSVHEGADQQPSYVYDRYEGTPLRKVSGVTAGVVTARLQTILSQRAAIMPDGTPPVRNL
jgi:hypothetical protein